MKKLEEFLKPTQAELFSLLCKKFTGKIICCKDSFILVKGTAPILLVAHLDTVHEKPVKIICYSDDRDILMSPQGIGGDDRCGVFALCKIYEELEIKPSLLFTCDEEIGGIGANNFCKAHQYKKLPTEVDNLKLIIEIDRRGKNDAVYYACDNPEFEKYITSKGFKTAEGSFSDISLIAPELMTAAVNLSSGYHNAHTKHEYINQRELQKTIDKVIRIVKESAEKDFPKFDYIEKEFLPRFYTSYDFHDELAKKRQLEDLPEEYKPYYQDFMDYCTSSDIADYKTIYKDAWADRLFDDILADYSVIYGGADFEDLEN